MCFTCEARFENNTQQKPSSDLKAQWNQAYNACLDSKEEGEHCL